MENYIVGQIFTGSYLPDVAIWCNENNYTIKEIDYNGQRCFQIAEVSIPNEVLIDNLKRQLNSSDYKIIKCYEASLVGEPMPYDIAALHLERQGLRDQINLLESTL